MRIRTTVAATLIVAVALSVGSAVLVLRLRQSLEDNSRNAALARAADIASLASSGRLPTVLGLPNEDATYAQVIDSHGTVIAASANIIGEPPLGPPGNPRAGPVVTRSARNPVADSDTSMLVSLPAGTARQPLTVLTGYSLAGSDFAVREVEVGLLIGLPLVLLLVGGIAYVIVGRALRPIDAVRAEAMQITTDDIHRRLPEPPSGDEITRLARTMNEMLDRLERSIERERQFIADASHELRSPLASLRAQLEIGLAGGDHTDWRATAAGALSEEARIEQLVKDLLLLARLDQQRRVGSRSNALAGAATVVDLAQIVSADTAGRSGMKVTTRVTGPAPVAMVAELARRMVANLVDNAQRHAVSEVIVAVRTDGSSVELVVHDDGPGVPPAERDRVFERFIRLDAARSTDDGGAGLGLAIVKDIVVHHGGSVGFTDCHRGARVVVTIPRAVPSPADRPEPRTPAAQSSADVAARS